jgi:hypothetical protein
MYELDKLIETGKYTAFITQQADGLNDVQFVEIMNCITDPRIFVDTGHLYIARPLGISGFEAEEVIGEEVDEEQIFEDLGIAQRSSRMMPIGAKAAVIRTANLLQSVCGYFPLNEELTKGRPIRFLRPPYEPMDRHMRRPGYRESLTVRPTEVKR